MWTAGLMQGLMWQATDADGALTHSFLASIAATKPFYIARFVGGMLVLAGMVVMAWNLWHTAGAARLNQIKPILVPIPEPIPEPEPEQSPAPLPVRG
jgi:cytochrome c oxidase cbb3-type subunit 1